MEGTVTHAHLKAILEKHTQVVVRKFAAILEENNERMGEYVQESIEAISALQVRHNHIQAGLRQSLEGVGNAIVSDISNYEFNNKSKN